MDGAPPGDARNRLDHFIHSDGGGGGNNTPYLSRALFEAVASRDHEALLRVYATNARASLLRYAAAKSRWSSWIPPPQPNNQSPSARLRSRQPQQPPQPIYPSHHGEFI
jgi:hypothetical protein